jgi:MraZ protein
MGSHFELWDKATHDEKEAQALAAGLAESAAFNDLAF